LEGWGGKGWKSCWDGRIGREDRIINGEEIGMEGSEERLVLTEGLDVWMRGWTQWNYSGKKWKKGRREWKSWMIGGGDEMGGM
jgi:hypothetical protein